MQPLEQIRHLFQSLNQDHSDLKQPLMALEKGGAGSQEGAAEIRQFLEGVAATLTTLDRAIATMGVKEALHVLQLRRLTEILEGQTADVKALSVGVEELTAGVTKVAEDTHQAAEAAGQMQEAGRRSLDSVGQVLQAVESLEEQARAAQGSVGHLVQQTRAAASGLKSIQGVAGTSKLLALNAAIQAAHANDRAFAVVAQEMRRLSDRTEQLVKQIEEQVATMEAAIAEAGAAMQTMAQTAGATSAQAREAAGDLEHVQAMVFQVSTAVQSIAAVAEEQAAATEEMSATAQDLGGRIQAAAESMNLTRNLAISAVTEQAHAALGRFNIGSQSDRMRGLMERAAADVEQTVERLVSGGSVRLDDLWDFNYREIKGDAIQSLRRLFRVDRVPATGFQPPKYRTGYDQQIDLPLIDLMDRYITEGRLQFCTVLDLNAFTLAHGRNMGRDWTGDYEQDLRGNRIKRLFTTDVSARTAARVALQPSLVDKAQVDRADLAGLPGPTPSRSFLLQTYALDSGEVVLAMAMPLFIQGRRWGAIRIGYQPES